MREELDRPLKDSTVRTVLRRLEEKGYLAHSVEDRTFIYRPAESRQRVAGRAVKRIVDWFCEGSVEALLVGMVDSKVLDRAELQRLATRIAAAQKKAGNRISPRNIKGGQMMIPLLIEAALRSLLLALAVWVGLARLPRAQCAGAKSRLGTGAGGALVMPMVLPVACALDVLPANAKVVLPR